MHQLTDSPLMLGLVTFAGLGPILLLSMWGGVVADRSQPNAIGRDERARSSRSLRC